MLFTTWQFAFAFLPFALGIFFLIPSKARSLRKAWLTVASFFFYAAWKVEYLPLLLLSIGFNFTVAELLCRWGASRFAGATLFIGVTGNLIALGYFKYTNFLFAAAGIVLGHSPPHFDIVLPLAISFFTFTQISYLVDVSRDPNLHYGLLDYTLFVAFFPHLIAGPIVRHWEIIPQYSARCLRLTRENLAVGLTLFLLGLGKKVLLADSAAIYADAIFGAVQSGVAVPWFNAWFGALAYALQIYFDFSGYSDMAIGLARLFDIKFPVNFDSPYRAANLADFWRRWHITLTRFLREYIYFPLGGNRCGPTRQACNVMLTFFLSGLWHGPNWTFVTWGMLHGFGLLVHRQWTRVRERLGWNAENVAWTRMARLLTFATVLVTWVYFRSHTLADANRMVGTMAGAHGFTRSISLPAGGVFAWATSTLGLVATANGLPVDAHAFVVIGALLLIASFGSNTQQLLSRYSPALDARATAPCRLPALGLRWGVAVGLLAFLVIRTQATSQPSPFLYFNF